MENLILSHYPIVVTTCQAAQSRRLKNIAFKKIIIDEASQASEIETLSTMMDAD
jgi:superfamily I DNA and/or RNA helicase